MKRTLLFCLIAAGFAVAQETATVDLEERRQSVVTLKQHLAMREERLAEVAAEIRERGEATDKKIGRIVDMLPNLKDSQTSKRRVSEVKGEAIAGLKKMLEVYKRERNAIVQQIRGDDSASATALMKDLQTIDQLAEKRVGQIVELVKQAQRAGAQFREVSVHHYARRSGVSEFFTPRRILHTYADLAVMWVELMVVAKLKGLRALIESAA